MKHFGCIFGVALILIIVDKNSSNVILGDWILCRGFSGQAVRVALLLRVHTVPFFRVSLKNKPAFCRLHATVEPLPYGNLIIFGISKLKFVGCVWCDSQK